MLKPMVLGASGFARLQVEGGGLLMQLTGKNLSPHAKSIRVFLYAGEGAVQELGNARVNPQGQATMLAEVALRQGGLAPSRLQAVLVTSDDPKPLPLFIGLCVAQSAGSLLDARNALLALCAKLEADAAARPRAALEGDAAARSRGAAEGEGGARPRGAEAKPQPGEGQGPGPREPEGSQEAEPEEPKASKLRKAPSSAARFALRTSSAMPRDFPPQEVFLSAVDPSIYVEADVYATRPPKGRGMRLSQGSPEPSLLQDGEDLQAAALTGPAEPSLEEDALRQNLFPQPHTPGARPVDTLRPVRWPLQWRQLGPFFDQYPSFAPFDMPGWRFVRVPMHRGGSFVVGRMCQEDRVHRVLYALPGQRNQPPPKEFARYRWQQGQDGQGYWALWQQVKAAPQG